jgi:hypothetical protein
LIVAWGRVRALRIVCARRLIRTRHLRPCLRSRAGIAIGLPAAFRAARSGVAAILAARAIAARIPRPVAPYVAIAVTIATVAVAAIPIAIPVAAAAEAIMTRIALRRPVA